MTVVKQEQVVNYPNLYVNGCDMTWVDNTHISISSGQMRDYTNTYDIIVQQPPLGLVQTPPLIVNFSINGIGGLDTGSIAASTWYSIYVIHDFTGFRPPVAIASLSSSLSGVMMPEGYGTGRRVGRIITNVSSQIVKFITTPFAYNIKYVQLDVPISLVSNGSSTSFTAFNVTNLPAIPVFLKVNYSAASAANVLAIGSFGHTSNFGNAPIEIVGQVAGSTATQYFSQQIILPVVNGNFSSCSYAVTSGSDVANILLSSWEDYV